MIFDCFPFFNELDLLEIRLHELSDVVDYFVLSEATVTHQNKPKPLFFEQNKDRFYDFKDKIIHNVITDASKVYGGEAWNIDHYMHNHFHSREFLSPEDIVIIGDADQICKAEKLRHLDFSVPHQLEMQYSYYFFNCVHTQMKWCSTFIQPKKDMHVDAHVIRYHPDRSGIKYNPLSDSGWHFSYMGGIERIRDKIQAFSDIYVNKPEFLDEQHLIRAIMEGKDLYNRTCEGPMEFIPIEQACPEYVLRNQDKFEKYIRRF